MLGGVVALLVSLPHLDTFNNDLEEGIASERGLLILEKFNENIK
jgi:hypothetical protein